jgi:hypothetical protein
MIIKKWNESQFEVITDPAKIAECFERDQEEYDNSLPEEWLDGKLKSASISSYEKPTENHENEIEQLCHVASELRNAGYSVQIDMIKFMQDSGLLSELKRK